MYWFFSTVVVGAIGGTILKHSLTKSLDRAEERQTVKKKVEVERYILNNELQTQEVSTIRWIVKGLQKFDTEHKYFNGELNSSFEELQRAEKAIEVFEREQTAKHRTE